MTDPAMMEQMISMFKDMAKTNQELVAAMKTSVEATQTRNDAPAAGEHSTVEAPTDVRANVALTNIRVPLEMGDSAEERLVNFHEWKEEVNDKLKVSGVRDKKLQTTIALMWGGKEIKTFATEKAGVILDDDTNGNATADTWEEAITKIEKFMEGGINESFAMFKFRQNEQGQRSINSWYKQLKTTVKTLRLGQCTCGHGYNEDRAIRDIMIELTNDSKLRKDGLSKDLKLTDVLKEGEANELARSRAASIEGKSVNKLDMTASKDDDLTDEAAELMIMKLKRAGKYSGKSSKDQKGNCDRCVNARKPHSEESCYFKDKPCYDCKVVGHTAGSKRCSKADSSTKKSVKKITIDNHNLITIDNGDFEDQSNSICLHQSVKVTL